MALLIPGWLYDLRVCAVVLPTMSAANHELLFQQDVIAIAFEYACCRK